MSLEPSIAFLAGGVDACSCYRLYYPYLSVPGAHGFYYGFDAAQILTHDYVCVQRLGLKQNLEAMKALRQADMRIIYDLDDFLWDIPDWNPAAPLLRQLAYGYSVCLNHADLITVSTYPLKRAIEKHHKQGLRNLETGLDIPVVVTSNKVDLRLIAPRQERDELIVGWAGSNTHQKDFDECLPALLQLAEEYPHVIFEFAGWIPPELEGKPNVRFRGWEPVSEYMQRYPRWGWTIALAPLFDHPFNRSKSAIKMCESGAIGIPCVASWSDGYADFVKTGNPELKWLLCQSSQSWYGKLKTLLDDAGKRERLGQLMRLNVEEHHSWNTPHSGWEKAFSTLQSI